MYVLLHNENIAHANTLGEGEQVYANFSSGGEELS